MQDNEVAKSSRFCLDPTVKWSPMSEGRKNGKEIRSTPSCSQRQIYELARRGCTFQLVPYRTVGADNSSNVPM